LPVFPPFFFPLLVAFPPPLSSDVGVGFSGLVNLFRHVGFFFLVFFFFGISRLRFSIPVSSRSGPPRKCNPSQNDCMEAHCSADSIFFLSPFPDFWRFRRAIPIGRFQAVLGSVIKADPFGVSLFRGFSPKAFSGSIFFFFLVGWNIEYLRALSPREEETQGFALLIRLVMVYWPICMIDANTLVNQQTPHFSASLYSADFVPLAFRFFLLLCPFRMPVRSGSHFFRFVNFFSRKPIPVPFPFEDC